METPLLDINQNRPNPKDKGTRLVCPHCSGEVFNAGFQIFHLSKILSQSGQPELNILQTFYCVACNKELDVTKL